MGDSAKANVKQKSRRAARATEEYMVLIKAAGVDDGDRLLKVSHKVAKRLRALDKNEHFEAELMQNYDNATIKLGKLKRHERHATKVAYDILRKRVKIKSANCRKRKTSPTRCN